MADHAAARKVLLNIWRQVTGQDPTLPELQIVQANAHLESGYGQASYQNKLTGERRVLNNWGAVQAGKPPCNSATSFEATDTHKDGTSYQACFRAYSTPEEGARSLLEHHTTKRPTSWAHAKRGDIDAWARQMHSYDSAGKPQKDPITGTLGYFEQKPDARAAGIALRIDMIAKALGEPIAARRGGPQIVLTPPTSVPLPVVAIPQREAAIGAAMLAGLFAMAAALVYTFARKG